MALCYLETLEQRLKRNYKDLAAARQKGHADEVKLYSQIIQDRDMYKAMTGRDYDAGFSFCRQPQPQGAQQ